MTSEITSGASTPVGAKDPPIDLENKHVKLTWTESTEEMLASWGDVSSCYKWLHEQAFRKFYRINYFMSIPIIILSTLTGTVSVGMSSLVSAEYVNMATQVVGGVNILTGIITTLQNFFHFAQLSEGHQHSSVGWNKLERNIRIELKIERKSRKDADTFIKVCRSEYDRLLEQSPVIPEDIIRKFKTTFVKQTKLIKPDICDILEHTEIAKVPFKEPYSISISDDDTSFTPTLTTSTPIASSSLSTPVMSSFSTPIAAAASSSSTMLRSSSWKKPPSLPTTLLPKRASFSHIELPARHTSVKDLRKLFQSSSNPINSTILNSIKLSSTALDSALTIPQALNSAPTTLPISTTLQALNSVLTIPQALDSALTTLPISTTLPTLDSVLTIPQSLDSAPTTLPTLDSVLTTLPASEPAPANRGHTVVIDIDSSHHDDDL
jgi:hypothetical protein